MPGRAVVRVLLAEVSAARPDLHVTEAFVDVQRQNAVVVPLLLSAGYHVKVDIATAVSGSPPVA